MKIIQKTVDWLDSFQARHSLLHYGVRLVKKYSSDEGGKLAALITYYVFLSLFPLLLAFATGVKIFLKNHQELRDKLIQGVIHYFPVIGTELENTVHSLNKTGPALVITLLVVLYGARGGADSFCYAMNRIWRVPKEHQPGFPASWWRSIKLIFWGGGGMLAAAVLSSYASALVDAELAKVISFLVSLVLLTGVFYFALKIVVDYRSHHRAGLFTSALSAAVGIQVLLALGGYILTHQLKHLSSLYGAFAVLLGLIFWIYLGVQVLLYAAEAGSLKASEK